MPPTDPTSPSPTPPEAPKPPQQRSFARIRARANSVSGVAVLLLAVLVLGGGLGYIYSSTRPKTTSKTTVNTLSPEEIQKLTDVGTSLGNTNQVLTIGANSLFKSNLNVNGDLTVGGRFSANGPVTLSQLSISGSTALAALAVGGDASIQGATTINKSLTVHNLLSVNGGLNVSGTASVNALNAGSVSTQKISISGPLTIGHLVTQGPAPGLSAGAVGAGGTVSISGNDTAGTINISTGAGPGALLATITFRASFSATPHIQLTPLTPDAAALNVYVTRAATGFAIHAVNPAAGAVYSFDYLVTQ
jgi:hypothetical protein